MGCAAATSICVNVSMSAETVDHRQLGGDCASGSDYQSRLPLSISDGMATDFLGFLRVSISA